MSDASDAIWVRDLSKRYGDRLAVDRLTFSVSTGSVTGFLGPNGAGKTTTMRILLGLAAASSGDAHIFGGPYRALDAPLSRVGAALETTGFHPGRTARDHLRIGPPDPILFGRAAAALVMVAYVGSALLGAVWLERRRDV
jgi:ABC-2 type transport system ATP-binding protein